MYFMIEFILKKFLNIFQKISRMFSERKRKVEKQASVSVFF